MQGRAGWGWEGWNTLMKTRFGGRAEKSNPLALRVWLGMMEVVVQPLCEPKPCACCCLGQAATFAPKAAK